MNVLYIALPIALLLGGSALLACLLCIRGGQFDDLDAESVRVLIDDDCPIPPSDERHENVPTVPSNP